MVPKEIKPFIIMPKINKNEMFEGLSHCFTDKDGNDYWKEFENCNENEKKLINKKMMIQNIMVAMLNKK